MRQKSKKKKKYTPERRRHKNQESKTKMEKWTKRETGDTQKDAERNTKKDKTKYDTKQKR